MSKTLLSISIILLLTIKLDAQSLKDSKWQLISIDNLKTGEMLSADSIWKATLYFNADASYEGFNGCNSYSGHFNSKSNSILVMDNPGRTKRGCPDRWEFCEQLSDIYPYTNYYKLQRDTLFLFTSTNLQLVDEEEYNCFKG